MKQGSGQDVVTVATGVGRWCACSGFPVLVNVFRTVLDVFGVGESRNGKTVRCVTSGTKTCVIFSQNLGGPTFLPSEDGRRIRSRIQKKERRSKVH